MILKIDKQTELRQLEQSDSAAIFKTIDSQREYLGKWLPFVEFTKKLADTEKFVDSIINASKDNFKYVFTFRKENKFIGLIGIKNTDKLNKKTEIGYWLSKEYQKQGIMTKSVDKLCDFAFKELELNRVQIKCAIDNKSSIKIPQRLGFSFEGIERQGELLSNNIFTDLEIYGKLKFDK